MDPTHRWDLYRKALRMDIPEENMHDIDEENAVKGDAYIHLQYSSEYSVFILFSIVEMLQDRKAELIEKAKEGEAGYIIKEILLRLNAINVILNDEKNDESTELEEFVTQWNEIENKEYSNKTSQNFKKWLIDIHWVTINKLLKRIPNCF
uniref:Uncharacterized protein n=1 Tax=Meloidogyne javanica TaxID=6303 RepID=A0A915N1F2_MELJA